jgi:hypothetical protein
MARVAEKLVQKKLEEWTKMGRNSLPCVPAWKSTRFLKGAPSRAAETGLERDSRAGSVP